MRADDENARGTRGRPTRPGVRLRPGGLWGRIVLAVLVCGLAAEARADERPNLPVPKPRAPEAPRPKPTPPDVSLPSRTDSAASAPLRQELSAPDRELASTLARALALREAGDAEGALGLLDGLIDSAVGDHVELLRVQLLRAKGDSEAARAAAEEGLERNPPSEVATRLLSELAGVHLDAGRFGEARAAQERAWEVTLDSDRSSRLAFDLANAFEARGLVGDALQLYRLTWRRWPLSDEAGGAYERSEALTAQLATDRPEPRSLLDFAGRLLPSGRCDLGLPVFEDVLARKELAAQLRREAERGRADCLFQRRRYSEAARAYAEIAKRGESGAVDAAILAARSHGRKGDRDRAVRELSEIARKGPDEAVPRARYLVALLLEDVDPRSSDRLFRLVAEQREDRGLAADARWRLAWQDFRGGRYDEAIRWLEPLTRGSIYDIEVQRARYWTAVATLRLRPEAGRTALEEIAASLPLTYYGILAADRIGLAPTVERSIISEAPERRSESPSERRVRILLEAGLRPLAESEIESWVRRRDLSRAERVAAAPLLHEMGDHFRAARLIINGFGGALEEGIDPVWREAWLSAWPQPFGGQVDTAVAEFDFDRAFVFAIMREESLFRPQVESPAGARGLMQIIPPTAKRIAKKLGVAPFSPDQLYEPDTNVRFGTFYLRELLQQFDGSQPFAIAAYNAGPEIVSEWLKRDWAGSTPDEFVDSVPYGETRRYLRRVLRSYRVYQLLYERSAAGGGLAGSAQLETAARR